MSTMTAIVNPKLLTINRMHSCRPDLPLRGRSQGELPKQTRSNSNHNHRFKMKTTSM